MIGEQINEVMNNFYAVFVEQIPATYRPLIILTFYTLLIAGYCIFIWKYYKFLARRDLFSLNLNRYNKSESPLLNKSLAILFFLLEYIIVLPFIVFFWFTVLSLFLLVLSKVETVHQILLVATAIVAATRMTAYFSEELSKDVAKLLPFTMLAIFLLEPTFFNLSGLLERFGQIPFLINNILFFMIFIAGIEVIMRLIALAKELFVSERKREERKA